MNKWSESIQKKLGRFRFIAAASIALILMGAGPGSNLPPSKTDLEKLRYLTAVREYIPNLFDNASSYETNLFSLLDTQKKLVDDLEKIPEYQNKYRKRPLIEFQMEPPNKRVLDAGAVQEWQKKILTELDRIHGQGDKIQFDVQFKQSLEKLGKGSTQGFTTGLINSLPKEKRGDLYSLSRDKQFEQLSELLPDDLAQAGFRGEQYGLQAHELNKHSALKALKSKIEAENEFQKLMELRLVLQGDDDRVEDNFNNAKKIIKNINEEKISMLGDRQLIEQQLKGLGAIHGREIDRSVAGKLEQNLKRLYSTHEGTSYLNKPMLVTEVPPELGIFRGYMGGDCATQNSFGYVWGPEDRTFMIRSAEGDLKGYLSATYVKNGNGEKVLYLHSINGPRISTTETKAIVQAMDQIKKDLGAKSIIMPSSNLYDLNNFHQIRMGFQQLSQGQKPVSLNYVDEYSREEISRVTTGKYELSASNKEGVLYREPDGLMPLKIEFNENKIKLVPKNISAADGLLLALDYQKKHITKTSETIREIMKVDEADFKELSLAIDNPYRKKTADYLKDIQKRLKKYDVVIDNDFIARKKSLLSNGLIQAADAKDAANIKLTKAAVFEQLETKHPNLLVYDFIEKNPELFREDPKTIAFMKKMMLDQVLPLEKVKKVQGLLQLKNLGTELGNWTKDADNIILRGNSLIVTSELKLPGYEKHLLDALSDPVEAVHLIAGRLMTQHIVQNPQSHVIPKIAKLLTGADSRRNYHHARILIMAGAKDARGFPYIKDPVLHQIVFDQLASENPLLRQSAIINWRQLDLNDNPKFFEYLKTLTVSEEPKLRVSAIKRAFESPAIRKSSDFGYFLSLYKDTDDEVSRTVIENLNQKQLLKLLKDEKDVSQLQKLAVKAASFNTPEMEKILQIALDSKEFNVLNSAIRSYYTRPMSDEVFKKLKNILLSTEQENIALTASGALFKQATSQSDALLYDLLSGKLNAKSLTMNKLIPNLNRGFSGEFEKKFLQLAIGSDNPVLKKQLLSHLIRTSDLDEVSTLALKETLKLLPTEETGEIIKIWTKRYPHQFPLELKKEIIATIEKGGVSAESVASFLHTDLVHDDDMLRAISKAIQNNKKEQFAWNLFQHTIDLKKYDQGFLNLMNQIYRDQSPSLQKLIADKVRSAHNTKLGQEMIKIINSDPTCAESFNSVLKTLSGKGRK